MGQSNPTGARSTASAHCGSNGGGAVGDKRPTDMGKDTDASTGIPSTASGELPEYPGSDFLAHNAATWLENATAKLGDLKLLHASACRMSAVRWGGSAAARS